MPYEMGPDLAGGRYEDVDFSNSRLHAANFEGAKITDACFIGADISGDLEALVLNGVEVWPLIRAELERRSPERAMLRAEDPAVLVEAWTMIASLWRNTADRARLLPAEALSERVDDEWSFIETQRHLVLATDLWLRRMIKGQRNHYHPWGIAGGWLADPRTWGLDPDASPSLDEVLDVRLERMDEVRAVLDETTKEGLARVCVPPESPGHPTTPHTVLECLHVILNEEWEHHAYAVRDLAILETRPARPSAMEH